MAMGGPQTVNNTYVNATMTIQQMNIQNMPPYMNSGPNMGHPNMGNQQGHMPIGGGPGGPMNMMGQPPNMQGQMGGPPPNMQGQMGPNMGMNMPQRMGGPQYPNQPPRMGPGNPMGGPGNPPGGPGRGGGAPYRMPNTPPNGPPRPFGGTNIQVKPNAPNTIQYLPARPPPPHNQGPSGMCSPNMGGPPGPNRSGPNLDFLQRFTNPSPGPVVNVNMGVCPASSYH